MFYVCLLVLFSFCLFVCALRLQSTLALRVSSYYRHPDNIRTATKSPAKINFRRLTEVLREMTVLLGIKLQSVRLLVSGIRILGKRNFKYISLAPIIPFESALTYLTYTKSVSGTQSIFKVLLIKEIFILRWD